MYRTRRLAGALGMAAALVAAEAAAQDAARGEDVFRRMCGVCHAVGEGARNKAGPVLNGILGRKAGTIAGFAHSEANRNSDTVWTAETLAPYLRDTRAAMPGTKMIFAGMKNDKDIADIVAYLAQFR